MFQVVSPSSTENSTFNDICSLKSIHPLNRIPHNSSNLKNRQSRASLVAPGVLELEHDISELARFVECHNEEWAKILRNAARNGCLVLYLICSWS